MDAIQLNWIPTPLKMMQTCEGWICKTWKWMGACLGLLKIDVGTKISSFAFLFLGFFCKLTVAEKLHIMLRKLVGD